jgi:hypothetical protein
VKLISQAEFGRQVGVSKQRVGVWVREGTITLIDGKIDPERSREELRRNLDWGRKYDFESERRR